MPGEWTSSSVTLRPNTFEVGQELFIWGERTEVLVIQGDPDADPGAFRVALRVPEDVFAGEWWRMVRAVHRYRMPVPPIDDGDDLVLA